MKRLEKFFKHPELAPQRQYEAIRAIVIDKLSFSSVAKQYNYSISTLYALMRDFKSRKLLFFSSNKTGPTNRQTPDYISQLIYNYRQQHLSAKDIKIRLEHHQHKCSISTIERILADANFPKLPRRTFFELGNTRKNAIIPKRSSPLNFELLEPFSYDCPVVGVFFFFPYIIKSGIIKILDQLKLPKSSSITSEQACLSMLLLKLVGNERLSHIAAYDHEPGLGVFSGLNFLPKSTYISTYSCRTSEEILNNFQHKIITLLQKKYPNFYQSSFINLDFHSIPHFGDESNMEKVWSGTRGKAVKGATTMFAQDGDSNIILYARADILRKNESIEIMKFIDYWKKMRKAVTETLVFDCRLTSYEVLDSLSTENINFITLRKRNKKLLEQTQNIPKDKWQKVYLPIPKRKYKSCVIHVSEIILPKCVHPVRQIIVTNHGRSQPTYVITNNLDLEIKEILIIYAKRWHIEQKFAELISFFNLNALSSPLMIRIHFDILWTIIADTMYRCFAQDLPRFETENATSIFRKFVNMPGQVCYDGKKFTIKIRKRSHTPILLGIKNLQQSIKVPWLENLPLEIEWTS